jgi:drug/metabolite transporter (DMT)-like permease
LYALDRGTPVLATVVAQLHPVISAALAGAILREHPTGRQTVGVIFALVGVALISIG